MALLGDVDTMLAARTRTTAAPGGPHDFFALASDMLCVAGVDGYFKAVNPAWSRTLGFTSNELLAAPYLDFVHPDDRAATVAEASKMASGSPTVHFRNRYRCKDGSYKWLAGPRRPRSWTAPSMPAPAI